MRLPIADWKPKIENRESRIGPPTQWVLPSVDERQQEELRRGLGISPILARILASRELSDPDQARAFLRPELDQLHDPSLLPDMTLAAERLTRAVADQERIVIYGDYDVDGATATALLLQCLRLAGGHVGYYIPERLDHGYGLKVDALQELKAQGAQVVVTVDCGVGAVAEAAAAADMGLCTIITDHHEPGPERPPAYAVVNAKLPTSQYPFTELSGVGVAFKLAWAIGQSFSGSRRVSEDFREFLLKAVALVALGTVADVVPLRGENRVLVSFGLAALEATTSPGIRAIMEVARLEQKRLTATHIAFGIAPRLNAAGRLGSARRAVELLITDSYGDASAIAGELDRCNRERQTIERGILQEAEAKIEREVDLESAHVLVVAEPGWHFGVVGIVASKLAEKYYRPTVMLTIEDDVARGSARSIPAFHLYDGLDACQEFLLGFGGHAQAAGVKLRADRIEEFARALDAHAGQVLRPEDFVPTLQVDADIQLSHVDEALVRELDRLAPFGHGNRQPILAASGVSLAGEPRRVGGDGKHLSCYVRQGDASMRTIAFGMGEWAEVLRGHPQGWAIAFVPQINEWGGRRSVELEIKDIQPDGSSLPSAPVAP